MPLFWRFQLGGWLAFVVLSFPVKVSILGSVDAAIDLTIFRDGPAFLVTWFLRSICKRTYGRNPLHPWRVVFVGAIASLVGGTFLTGLTLWIQNSLGIDEETALLGLDTFRLFYFTTVLCGGWILLYFAICLLRDASAREKRMSDTNAALREAELKMLRAQMEPHFLLNALNTVQSSIVQRSGGAAEIVQSLADYLTYSLGHADDEFVQIGAEFDALVDYLAVEKARYRDDLIVNCEIEPKARQILVPGILLQPLVENAIKHGRETSASPLQVRMIVTIQDGDTLEMEVANTGTWKNSAEITYPGRPAGIGLANIRRRLSLLYPDEHEIVVTTDAGWVRVVLRIPTHKPYEDILACGAGR